MKDLLGGKGADLAEMTNLGLPVPPGFTITTEVCTDYYAHGQQLPDGARRRGRGRARARSRSSPARQFGDPTNPLLVSVRSGARASMPGMMDTILNLGLNDETVDGARPRSPATRASPRTATAASSRCTATSCSASSHERRSRTILERRTRTRSGVQARHRPRRRATARSWSARYKAAVEDEQRQARSRRTRTSSSGARSARCSARWMNHARRHLPPAERHPGRAGAPPSTCRRWCSATWATTRPPASPSPATRRPARRSSTASS